MLRRGSAILASVALATMGVHRYYRSWLPTVRRRAHEGSLVAPTSRGPVEYDVRARGPTVLHFHGGNLGHNGWFFLAHLVGSGYRLLTPNRPGYLGTPLGDNGSSEAQADVAAALLDALEVERVAVVGISAGGHAAIQFAARHPERTRALVLLSAVSRRTPLSDAPAEQRPRSPDDDPQVPKPGVFPDPRRAARPQFSGDALGPGQLSPAGSARWPQG